MSEPRPYYPGRFLFGPLLIITIGVVFLLRRYDAFFLRSDVMILPISSQVFRLATVIQAMHDFATVDAIHLATAVENGCEIFVTHDTRLSRCTDLTIEVLT